MVACNRAARPLETLQLYQQMRSGACALSEHSIAATLVACRNLADWQQAQAIFDGSKSITSVSVMCNEVLLDGKSAYLQAGM